MKKLLLTLTMLLCVGGAFGQTSDRLMKKYKAMPNAKYEENTEEVRKYVEENKNEGVLGLTGKDYDFVLKHFMKSEYVELVMDDNQTRDLQKDIEALKGYELLVVQNDHKETTPNYRIFVYGKVKGDNVKDLLVRCDISGKTVLQHFDCKVKKDLMVKATLDGDLIRF